MADEQRRDRDGERNDRTPSDDREARDTDDSDDSRDDRALDLPRRRPLTPRERDERWPIG